jgi:S-adenosylmethionine:tRNA ribosyltransferase-isomerase
LTGEPGKQGRGFRTADFDYALPPELIAQQPLSDRAASRLLVVTRPASSPVPAGPSVSPLLADRFFRELPQLIPPGDLVVLNTTRVRHARFLGARPSGAPAEVLLLHPGEGDGWVAMGTPGSALRPGRRIQIGPEAAIETVAVLPEGYRLVRFVGVSAEQAIARWGRLPLPPYISRDPTPLDLTRYQTVFAEREGSVAAPTAGLHFTPELLEELEDRGVRLARLDLEVGPGTFRPVEVEDPVRHPMHPERFEIPPAAAAEIAQARRREARVWAVGTTVVRALESAGLGDGTVRPGRAETRLLITPGFRFQVTDRLITNFHLPRSTLLMLVAAFAGYPLTMAAYRHAVEARYRFYSYGDAMVVV